MQNISVLVYDSGFYSNHEDLRWRSLSSLQYSEGNFVVRQGTHGTHVAEIIDAEFNNRIGVSGIAPNSQLHGMGWDMARGRIEDMIALWGSYIRNADVKVINFSGAFKLLEFAYSRENTNAEIIMENTIAEIERHLLWLITEQRREFVIVVGAGNGHEQNLDRACQDYRFSVCTDPDGVGYREDPNGTLTGIGGIFSPFALIQNGEVRSRILMVGATQNIRNFEFWAGAIDRVKYFTGEQLDTVEEILIDIYPNGIDDTTLNDLFWFDEDMIAEWLGYDSFEDLKPPWDL